MTIKNGNYTFIDRQFIPLHERRTEVPTPQLSKLYHLINKDGSILRVVPFHQLPNMIAIKTFGSYADTTVKIFEAKLNQTEEIFIASSDMDVGKRLEMNEVNVGWYMKKIFLSELDVIWEKRTTLFDFVLPEGVEEVQIIMDNRPS